MELPTDYGFLEFDADYARKNGPVVLAVRASGPKQEWAGNLDEQEAWMRKERASNRVRIACSVCETMTGQGTGFARIVAQKARECKARVVVAESMDRIMRPTGWSVREQERWYDAGDLKNLQKTLAGVTVMTVTHPDAPLAEVRAAHTKRGQKMKTKDQPKKYRKPLRDALKAKVLRMRRNGKTIRYIAENVGVPYQTIHYWLNSTHVF